MGRNGEREGRRSEETERQMERREEERERETHGKVGERGAALCRRDAGSQEGARPLSPGIAGGHPSGPDPVI